jgi:hypothetical protein
MIKSSNRNRSKRNGQNASNTGKFMSNSRIRGMNNTTASWRNIRLGRTVGTTSNKHEIGRVYTSD